MRFLKLIIIIKLLNSLIYAQQFTANIINPDRGFRLYHPIDINNDGFKDLIIFKKSLRDSLFYIINNGNGTFSPQKYIYTINAYPNFPYLISNHDFNNDGLNDIVAPVVDTTKNGSQQISIAIFYNDASHLFNNIQIIDSLYLSCSVIHVADINNDGLKDIILGAETLPSTNSIFILYNNGNGSFQRSTPTEIVPEPYGLDIDDIDNDGNLEVVFASTSIYIFENNNGILTLDTLKTNAIPNNNTNLFFFPVLEDFNNDGFVDLTVKGNSDIYLYINDGTGNFNNVHSIYSVQNSLNLKNMVAADLNKDSYMDLIIANSTFGSNAVGYFINNKNGSFSSFVPLHVGNVISYCMADDFNNDNYYDIMASDSLVLYLNDKTSNIGEKPSSVKVYYNNGKIILDNIELPIKVEIYDLLGKKLYSNIIHTYEFPLKLPKNVYIIKATTSDFKVIHKKLLIY